METLSSRLRILPRSSANQALPAEKRATLRGTGPAVGTRMKTKIQGGTTIHGETSLCVTCHHSTIIRGQTLDEEIVDCGASFMRSRQIRFRVTSCSSYSDARLPSYSEMVRSAWILTPHSKRRAAGFIPASQLDPAELRELLCADPDNTEGR